MRPVSVSIDVPQPREEVYDYLDVLANHEAFTDHMMVEWQVSGPARGVGAKVSLVGVLGGRRDPVDIEVVSADPPREIVERNVSAGGKRRAHGTYLLEEAEGGGTRVTFTYAWESAPLSERVMAPMVRAVMRRPLARAMERLAAELATRSVKLSAG